MRAGVAGIRAGLIAALLAACCLPLGQAEEQPAAAKGDLWETTTQIAMEGMPNMIPAQKRKVCSPKVWTEPPGGMDERQKCTTSDFVATPQKATWKVRCEGPPAMSGTGEITRDGADAYNGTIKLTSSEGSVNIALTGRRAGECDIKP